MPRCERRMCARHVYARFGKSFPNEDLKLQFWKCARTCNEFELRAELDTLKGLNEATYDLLMEKREVKTWSLAYALETSKCDVIDNNMCETFNGLIVEARFKPIISMLEEIRVYVMRRLVKNKLAANSWKREIGARIITKLEKK